MRIVTGKRILEIDAQELAERRRGRPLTMIDLGTGDGRFAYRWAREHRDTFCIGLDPVAEAMREVSHKASRKPARGGLDNVIFVVASIERRPDALVGLADRLFVNYPWGSLLEAFVVPDRRLLANVVSFARPGADLTVLLNYSVFEDSSYLERLDLPPFDRDALGIRLAPALEALGVQILEHDLTTGAPPYATSWQRRLVAGSSRKTLRIEARVRD